MTMFMPKGAQSRRVMLTDLVRGTDEGEVISYEDLAALLEVDSRAAVQSAVNGAKLPIERDTDKALEAVPNVGYRVVPAADHLRLAVSHQRRSVKQVRRAKSKVDNIDVTGLTVEERSAVVAAGVAFAAQQRFFRVADARYAKREELDRFMVESSKKHDRTESETKELQERLARLESKLGG